MPAIFGRPHGRASWLVLACGRERTPSRHCEQAMLINCRHNFVRNEGNKEHGRLCLLRDACMVFCICVAWEGTDARMGVPAVDVEGNARPPAIVRQSKPCSLRGRNCGQIL